MTRPPSKPRRYGWLAVAAVVAAILAWAIFSRVRTDDPDAAVPRTASVAGTSKDIAGKPGAQLLDKPLWRELTRAQQLALEPLHPEWDAMDGTRKKKWLEMSRRFASMNPAEQARVHERMRQWIRLTPEQRNLARENYNKARKLAPGEKAATWESYKQLTPGERQRLAQTAARRNAAGAKTPAAGGIVAPTSCPAGTTRRGASCIALQAPNAMPPAPALSQPGLQPGLQPAPSVRPRGTLLARRPGGTEPVHARYSCHRRSRRIECKRLILPSSPPRPSSAASSRWSTKRSC
ncbi:DUF3106 domain-containing protein [Massilia sp. Dwa41.01b]|uniref:DUF3106 domain-containing protein n=1 Tax=Massilia sp. Dwa41.01b TaxID=2709302 RepID=UPI001602EC21|nr:DUF3106 domain-containing protein [Massilia sp. Dwa41.01b]QNA89749.1 DUF3106 domain-containing protein [Massilia sp. Dwa41.01b]